VEPDPCGKILTADFKIMENTYISKLEDVSHYWQFYYSDTVLICSVELTATQDSTEGVSYLWKIGEGVYTKRSFDISFCERDISEYQIPITLQVTANKYRPCSPQDNGIASFTKNITFVKSSSELAYRGTFRGRWENGDTVTMKIDPFRNTGTFARRYGLSAKETSIWNFDGKRKWYYGLGKRTSYKQKFLCCFYEDSLLLRTYPIFHDQIWIRLADNNQDITIKYKELERKTNIRTPKTFIGKRISYEYENN